MAGGAGDGKKEDQTQRSEASAREERSQEARQEQDREKSPKKDQGSQERKWR